MIKIDVTEKEKCCCLNNLICKHSKSQYYTNIYVLVFKYGYHV